MSPRLHGGRSTTLVHYGRHGWRAHLRIGDGLDCNLAEQPGLTSLYGTTLSAGSIEMPNPGGIDVFDNTSITLESGATAESSSLTATSIDVQSGGLLGGGTVASSITNYTAPTAGSERIVHESDSGIHAD